MEFTDRGINPQESPRVPPMCVYLTDKPHPAHSVGPDIGQTQTQTHQELFRDHCHLYSRHLRHSLPSPNPHNLHESIQIEMEKEKIRDEILISEIARRRVLEAEVRRELLTERGSAVSSLLSPVMGHVSTMGATSYGRFLEESLTSLMNGKREGGRFETLPFQRGTLDLSVSEVIKPFSDGGHGKKKLVFLGNPDENVSGSKTKHVTPARLNSLEIQPFIRNTKELGVSEVKPVSEAGNENQNVIFLGKREENVSGSKTMAVTPARLNSLEIHPFLRNTDELKVSDVKPVSEAGNGNQKVNFLGNADENISGSKRKASDFPPSTGGFFKKKPKEKWICSTCQINCTGESSLNDHLQGRKHRSKEAAFRAADRAKKSYDIGLSSKQGATVDAVVEEEVESKAPKLSTLENSKMGT